MKSGRDPHCLLAFTTWLTNKSLSFRHRRKRPPHTIPRLELTWPVIHNTLMPHCCVLGAARGRKPAFWVHAKAAAARIGCPLLICCRRLLHHQTLRARGSARGFSLWVFTSARR